MNVLTAECLTGYYFHFPQFAIIFLLILIYLHIMKTLLFISHDGYYTFKRLNYKQDVA